MALVILTKSPRYILFSKEKIKDFARSLIGKERGPQAIINSLCKGLDELNYSYKFNPKIKNISSKDIIYATGSIEALKLAIKLKKNKKIKKLIAGPTLVITPEDYNGLIRDENIDTYLVPSQWTKNFYASFGPDDFSRKIKIWAAGVDLPEKIRTENKNICLLYKKNIDSSVLGKVKKELKRKKIKMKTVYYGKYKKEKYFNMLNNSSFMVYLQEIESQGIALLEAWARNIPTLVYNKGSYTFKKIGKTVSGNIAAPYLTYECGFFFNENNLEQKFDYFLKNIDNFTPREYIKKNFTNKICAQNFLNSINL
jgi:hypothetical protein